jgi:hypothetical protein
LRFSWDLLEILNWAKPINPNTTNEQTLQQITPLLLSGVNCHHYRLSQVAVGKVEVITTGYTNQQWESSGDVIFLSLPFFQDLNAGP